MFPIPPSPPHPSLPPTRTPIIPPPPLHPPLHPLQIPLDILGTITPQLDHNLLPVGLARLIQQDLHNLAVHVLLELLSLVAPGREPVVEDGGVAAQDDDEVDPALGEEVAGVPVEYVAAGCVEGEGF
ncbi:predicted protein [Plenodomus lingam JN3]|uniref:Predicted protein n=1 Tax=Leptosphaeria maculans (strain JN3 / isolate v23.1.3 / race Av1-4-5-6-7-8) TaxID=985895 RepID=E5ABK9_LEPMJ|nr:predicted protein [Plenodomus lingam JN3]CBY01050.1 predicted protein [Plenodomus lingam JN3]